MKKFQLLAIASVSAVLIFSHFIPTQRAQAWTHSDQPVWVKTHGGSLTDIAVYELLPVTGQNVFTSAVIGGMLVISSVAGFVIFSVSRKMRSRGKSDEKDPNETSDSGGGGCKRKDD
ncbi:MAG: hypothetical protein ABIE03_07040 [Patescibacteria group bacterium]|nr:hypothetical protein [Patescibacteria group bacterium]